MTAAERLDRVLSAMRFQNTITIRRPPAEVFAYLADFENVPAWNYAIVETRKLSQAPVGVGDQVPPDPQAPPPERGELPGH